MIEDLIIQVQDKTPIFQQLENQILRFIHAGRLKPGEELPSGKAIATHLAINPMTVSKTINRLVEAGWLVHQRGKATCVAKELPQHDILNKKLNNEIQLLIDHCKQLNLSQQELIILIEQLWNKGKTK